jgi:dolichol-phosphate mannosyltransferase
MGAIALPTLTARDFSGEAAVTAASRAVVDVSVVVPTLNEATNLPALLERVGRAMGEWPYEVLVVDDGSRDGTGEVCAGLAARHPLRLHVRDDPRGGLSGAVLHGFSVARGRILAVMDADLQHPPESLPNLVRPIERGDADFVIGSRYAEGGAIEERWGLWRRLNSRAATVMARPLTGRLSDPMSGFFAISRAVWEDASPLNPLGYKIALELLCKCRPCQVREVPIQFHERRHGRSKLNATQQLCFLRHLARLYAFRVRKACPFGSAHGLLRAGGVASLAATGVRAEAGRNGGG